MYNPNIDSSKTREVDVVETPRKSVVAGEEVVLNEDIKKDNSKTIDEEKNKKLLDKKIIIGIICILAVILCSIIYLAFISNKDSNDDSNGLKNENNLLVNDNEKYEGLNYSMIKENIVTQGFFYDYSKNLEGNKVDVSYIKVEGLKDKSLEQKINESLKEEVEALYNEKNLQDPNVLYNHIYNYTDVYIFNNVLSTMYCEEKCDIEGNVVYIYKGVNINLKDLKEFKIQDIFINTANLSEIFLDLDNLEKDVIFSVSPKNIYYLNDEGKIKIINLYEHKDTVAIYKRFNENKKIFEKTYNSNPYAFTTKKFFEADVYGLEEDNLFIDTCNLLIEKDINDKIKEAANTIYKEAVNKARNLSYSNPSKRYLVQIIPSLEKNKDSNYVITVKSNTYEIEKKFFNENIERFVIESENKIEKEIVVMDFFKDAVINGDEYLNNLNTDTIKKEFDEDGKEINYEKETNLNIGIS